MNIEKLPNPPAGMKWVVSSSMWEGWAYDLGLYPADADVDEHGCYKREFGPYKGFPNGGSVPAHSSDSEPFNHPRQMRRAARKILRAANARAIKKDELEQLRKALS